MSEEVSYYEDFAEIQKKVWSLLTDAVKNRDSEFRTPVFICGDNKDLDGRVVVLRKFDPSSMTINFHTDFRSPKVRNLKNNSSSQFVFYDHKLKIQMRIKTTSLVNNQNDKAKEMWDKTRLFSRKCYLTLKDPSSITEFPEDGIPEHLTGKEPSHEESEKGYKNFTVVENKINEIDWLYLAANGHRRLKIIIKEKAPSFQWIIP